MIVYYSVRIPLIYYKKIQSLIHFEDYVEIVS